MRRSLLPAPLALVLVLGGCAAASNPEINLAAEEAALRQADDDFAAAGAAKDVNALMSFFAPDATMLMQNQPAVRGIDGIRGLFDQIVPALGSMSWSATEVMVAAAGDIGITRGTYHMTLQTPAGPVDDVGKYVTVWKKVDGQWKVVYDVGNTDMPAAEH
jgi:ketosteroid isomerase-like protein